MRFEQEVSIAAPIDEVWEFLMDIPAMSACIPGAENVEQIEENKYAACIRQKVGPLSVRFECQVSINSIDKAAYTASAQVSGRDSKLASGIRADMSMNLEPQEEGVLLKMVTDADIMGKIGQYGHGIIKQKANALTKEFGVCVQEQVAARIPSA